MNYKFLSETEIFRNIAPDEIKNILECMNVREKKFLKGEYILRVGDKVSSIGLVVSGSVNIEKDEIWGSRSIISNITKGHIFAEVYACVNDEPLMVNVVAAEDSEVLFFNTQKLLTICTSCCEFHNRVIVNLLSAMAHKNINLTRKISVITPKSIRERILEYLSFQSMKNNSSEFEIPFNRQQLADYLNVDRSALSNELGKMKNEGLIEFRKNKFSIRAKFHKDNN